MAAIWDFEDLQALEDMFTNAFEVSVEMLLQSDIEESERANDINLERVYIVGDWANDLATEGGSIMEGRILLSEDGVENELLEPGFDEVARPIVDGMEQLINSREINTPEEFFQKTIGVDIEPTPESQLEELLNFLVTTKQGDKVFDLTTGNAIVVQEGVNLRNFPRIPLETLRAEEEPEEEPEEEEPEEEPEEEEPELTEEEFLEQKFPEVPKHLRPFAVTEERLEVTVGQKDTKTVEPREPYDFEIIQATARPSPLQLRPFRAEQAIGAEVKSGIGEAIRSGDFGDAQFLQSNQIAPGSYPRTSTYIRNYLKFEGPAYPLQIFNDFLVYLALVNYLYDYELRIGTYNSFREFFYVLRQINERGGPMLIDPLIQQEAAQRGLSTVPDHPTIEGEKAPWLERRQYYELVEENEDHEAWDNPYEYLHTVVE